MNVLKIYYLKMPTISVKRCVCWYFTRFVKRFESVLSSQYLLCEWEVYKLGAVIRQALWFGVVASPTRSKVNVLMATAASWTPLIASSVSSILKLGQLDTGDSLVFMGWCGITLHFWMSGCPLASWSWRKWKCFLLVWLFFNANMFCSCAHVSPIITQNIT